MGYVTVKKDDKYHLQLCREPSLWSWSILVALVSFALAAAYYGSDPFLWKAVYILGGVAVGLSCLEDWEECDFDQTTGEIRMTRKSVWSILLPSLASPQTIVSRIDDIVGVRVADENVRYFGKGHQVTLLMRTGIALGITESFTFGDMQEHYAIAEKIKTFLDLESKITIKEEDEELDDSSSGDSFEQIEHSDLNEEQTEQDNEMTQEIKPDVL